MAKPAAWLAASLLAWLARNALIYLCPQLDGRSG